MQARPVATERVRQSRCADGGAVLRAMRRWCPQRWWCAHLHWWCSGGCSGDRGGALVVVLVLVRSWSGVNALVLRFTSAPATGALCAALVVLSVFVRDATLSGLVQQQ